MKPALPILRGHYTEGVGATVNRPWATLAAWPPEPFALILVLALVVAADRSSVRVKR